jgi:hypothetical protein
VTLMTETVGKPGLCADPVFVCCSTRTGSTLLRFLLDAHVDLACPAETRLPWLCSLLAQTWTVLEGVPMPAEGQKLSAAQLSDQVVARLRQSMDLMMGSHLARRGKTRYCDKSLEAAQNAELLLRVYPEAKFLCLYRHPMDMIASGLEVCPWGLSGYGFDGYAAASPGNMVAALGRYWADNAALILAAEEQFPASCHRVRYEDLVAAPEDVASVIFSFLGVAPAPGITERCFALDRERSGPADYKIWNTSRITAGSVGRGWSVPAHIMPATLLARINGLAEKLGYLPVDEKWGVGGRPADVRVAAGGLPLPAGPLPAGPLPPGPLPAGPLPPGPLPAGNGAAEPPGGARLLAERIQGGLARLDEGFAGRWQPCSGEAILLVAAMPGSNAWWRLDLVARTVTAGLGDSAQDADWSITGPPATWERVLRYETNLGVMIHHSELRYRDRGNGGPGSVEAERRVAMIAEILGITRWLPVVPVDQQRGADAALAGAQSAVPDLDLDLDAEADLDAELWPARPVRRGLAAQAEASSRQLHVLREEGVSWASN